MKTASSCWPHSALYPGILLALTLVLLTGCGGTASLGSGGTSPVIPAITISSITPKEVPAGSTAVTVTVSGSNFPADSVIVLNGVSEPTTYVSSTQLQAIVPATQMQTGQVLSLAVRTSTATTNASTGTTLQVDNPIPTVTTLAPAATLIGSASTTVTITGTNFVSGVVATVNGNPRTTTLVSDTQLTVALPPTDLTTAGTLLMNVSNPQPGGGASGTAPFTVTNPSPTVSALAPATLQVGGQSTSVTVTGTGFVNGTTVLVNGATRPTTFVTATSVTVGLAAADLGYAGTLAVTAVNPGPGGGVSSSAALTVNNPAPGTLTIAPTSVVAGTTGSTVLTVTGTGFVSSTVVQVNGTARPTTYVSSTQLLGTLSTTDLGTAGVLAVSVATPPPGGGSALSVNLPVNNPSPGAILVSPNLVSTATPTPTSITVTGANFMPSTVVQVNGSSRPTTYISSTQLQSALTVADQASGGSLSINAFTPAPGGGLSPAASIAVNNPVLGTLTLSPNTVPQGLQSNAIITVTGSGFIPGTSIQVNGGARTTSYVSPTQLTFTLLASDAAATGKLNVTAVNPAPAASTSPTAFLTVATATATPVITSTNPSSFIISNVGSSIYVYGTGLTTTSTIQWNGTNLATYYSYGTVYNGITYVSSYYLYAAVPASLLATAGTASVTVYSPTALTTISNAVTININNPPVPTLTGISPGAGAIATDAKVTLTGTGFTSSSVVSYKGTPLPTTYGSSGSLTVTIPGTMNLFPGNGNLTVFTPAPGGGTSNAQPFTSYVPFTSNSMIYNPVNGLLYLSVPASVGAPYGNSVVPMDPATGALGTPISVGSEPNKLALTSDGKYLWVGLDGASGVRRIDLTTNTAGLQFAFNPGTYGSPTAQALAAMPGSSTSVIVLQGQAYYSAQLAIYDNGSLRGSLANVNYYGGYDLQVDSTRSEIYVGGSGLYTYTYSSTGLASKVTNSNSNIALGNTSLDDMQLVSGQLFSDFGKVYDSESGTLLGTFYQSGTTVAQGATYYDPSLGKVFVLDNNTSSSYYYSGYNQIQIFSPSDYSASSTVIPINVPYSVTTASGNYLYFNPHKMFRWGSNGLAFHTAAAIFSLQSNSVKDLSSTVADLSVTASASGGTTTGTQTTYTTTITNSGPSDATDVALAIQVPSTGVLVSASATSGTCSTSTSGCSFGTLTNGSSVTATITVLETSAGTATMNAQVGGSTTDNVTSNNTASASVTVTGSTYNLAPTLTSVSPAAIRSGSADTTITVVGTNFAAGSAVMLGSTVLNTTYTSATQLSATVPASSLSSMGYVPISVSVPAPGGGNSNSVPLTIYSVISLGVNHIAYDGYSRKLMATVSTGSNTVAANSLVAITPETATVGTPITLTAQPTKMALSPSGQTLWVGLNNTQSIVHYDMLSGTADTVPIPNPPGYSIYYVPSALELTVQPGTENTLAMSLNSYYYGTGIYDYSSATKTLTGRSGTSAYYYNGYSCMRFLDATNLFANSDSSSLINYTVSSTGLTSTTGNSYTLNRFGCFKIANGKAYASQGGVASVSSSGIATQIGSFTLPSTYSYSSGNPVVAPDLSIGQVFFPGSTTLTSYGSADGLLSYDAGNYLRNATLPLNIPAIEGTTSYSVVDLVRWGQDGLAMLTSTGHIYLVRGPFVVPQLLNSNSPAVISSASTLTHGNANVLLTISGSNFVPGVAVTWNGSYRTTTITDSTHLTVAIPATDVAAPGTATVVATNPGANASSALTVTIQ